MGTTTIKLILPLLALSATTLQGQEAAIDTLALRAHTSYLSHDLLKGRATASRGERLAAAYIAAECRALGLGPLSADFRQTVPLEEALVLETTDLVASAPGGDMRFGYPADFLPNVGTASTLVDFGGATVFVGDSRTVAGGGLGDLDVTGKVAVTLGPFRGAAADTLTARGVAGMIHLVGDEGAFQLYARSRGATRLYHREADVRSSFLPELPSVLAGPRMARALLAEVAWDSDEGPSPTALAWTVAVHVALERRPVDAANVACALPGADSARSDTAIVFTAHYDHLGIGTPDETGDSLYNGFSDNAAGVAMLLAIAQSLAGDRSAPLDYSVVFLFLSGEERGLLGSDYYVVYPLWPLKRTAAVINLDAGAPPAPPTSWHLAGVDSTGLGAIAIGVAADHGWDIATSSARPNSDYYPFAREGVPALFIIPGPAPYEGLTADSSKALRRRWDHYHQPGDEWAEDFPFGGLARYAGYALRIAREIDTGTLGN